MTKEAGKMEVGHAIVTAINGDSQGREVVINLNGQKDMIALRLIDGLATGWYRGFSSSGLYSISVADTDRALHPDAADLNTALATIEKLHKACRVWSDLVEIKNRENTALQETIDALRELVKQHEKEVRSIGAELAEAQGTLRVLEGAARSMSKAPPPVTAPLGSYANPFNGMTGGGSGNDRKQYPEDVVALANEAHAGQKPGMGVTPADIAEAIMKDRLAATEFNRKLGRDLADAVENPPKSVAVGIWPNIEIVRSESEQPVPSHGGPARSVTWTLCVNGIAIDRANKRFEWGYTGSNRYETPGGLLHTKDLLEQALHGKMRRQ